MSSSTSTGVDWKWEVLLDDLNNPRPLRREPVRIGAGGGADNRFQGSIDDVRIYDRALSAAEAKVLADPMPVEAIAAVAAGSRSAAQSDKLRDYFLEHAAPPAVRLAWNQLRDARASRDVFYDGLPTVMVMEEMPTPRESHILLRGVLHVAGREGDTCAARLPGAAGCGGQVSATIGWGWHGGWSIPPTRCWHG